MHPTQNMYLLCIVCDYVILSHNYYLTAWLSFTGSHGNSAVDPRQSSNQVLAQQAVLLISLKSVAGHSTTQHESEW